MHALKPDDYIIRCNFALTIIDDFFGKDLIDTVLFRDEPHLHLNGKMEPQLTRSEDIFRREMIFL